MTIPYSILTITLLIPYYIKGVDFLETPLADNRVWVSKMLPLNNDIEECSHCLIIVHVTCDKTKRKKDSIEAENRGETFTNHKLLHEELKIFLIGVSRNSEHEKSCAKLTNQEIKEALTNPNDPNNIRSTIPRLKEFLSIENNDSPLSIEEDMKDLEIGQDFELSKNRRFVIPINHLLDLVEMENKEKFDIKDIDYLLDIPWENENLIFERTELKVYNGLTHAEDLVFYSFTNSYSIGKKPNVNNVGILSLKIDSENKTKEEINNFFGFYQLKNEYDSGDIQMPETTATIQTSDAGKNKPNIDNSGWGMWKWIGFSVLILLVLLCIGGLIYYFKVIKMKKYYSKARMDKIKNDNVK